MSNSQLFHEMIVSNSTKDIEDHQIKGSNTVE